MTILVINCCITHYSKHGSLPAHIYYLTLFTCQKPGCGLARTPGSESLIRLQAFQSLTGKNQPPCSLTCCWQDSVPLDSGLHSSLPFLPCRPLHRAPCFIRVSKWEGKESTIESEKRGWGANQGWSQVGGVWVREWALAGWMPASCNLITFMCFCSLEASPQIHVTLMGRKVLNIVQCVTCYQD